VISAIVWGIALVVVAGLVVVLRKAGKDAERARGAADTIKAGERIAESQGKRVDSLDALRDELRDGSGKL
jgi:hypothetical protein